MNGNGPAQAIATLEQAIVSLPVGEIADFVGNLKRLEMLAIARLMQRPEPDNRPPLDAHQVAVRLNVKESYIYELARRGELKSFKMGKYRQFTEAAVTEYLRKQGA